VFKIVVSSDSMKKATAIIHGRRRRVESDRTGVVCSTSELGVLVIGRPGGMNFRN
jgi:hypothetical protein